MYGRHKNDAKSFSYGTTTVEVKMRRCSPLLTSGKGDRLFNLTLSSQVANGGVNRREPSDYRCLNYPVASSVQ